AISVLPPQVLGGVGAAGRGDAPPLPDFGPLFRPPAAPAAGAAGEGNPSGDAGSGSGFSVTAAGEWANPGSPFQVLAAALPAQGDGAGASFPSGHADAPDRPAAGAGAGPESPPASA